MSSQFFAAIQQSDTELIAKVTGHFQRRLASHDMYACMVALIKEQVGQGLASRELVAMIRLAIKLNPYSPDSDALITLHNGVVKALAEAVAPGLFDIFQACGEKNIPVPVIISCEKYLPKARQLQARFRDRYFSIEPLIIRGDAGLSEERFESGVLTLPVDDSYEALPVKIFEICAYLQALGEERGMIKIDDDMILTPGEAPTLDQTHAFFATADYMGMVQDATLIRGHDRLWHHGKCSRSVPPVYGKPVKALWCDGPLYFLSSLALKTLTRHYLRFPACLEGELYEDKAVADTLYDYGVMATMNPIESLLGIDSTNPERPV